MDNDKTLSEYPSEDLQYSRPVSECRHTLYAERAGRRERGEVVQVNVSINSNNHGAQTDSHSTSHHTETEQEHQGCFKAAFKSLAKCFK